MQKNVSSTHILRSNCPVAIERHVKRHVEIFFVSDSPFGVSSVGLY